ncbi:SAG1386/EF1546 family surface-associated protein [Enterococcus sp. PF1-24]|uniref:SAG1386/EF1546 family surface-associated protein n=1 Tax=unclassified Enterococcus TaxID=2608891 RepID=UPI0032AF7928
MNDQKKNRATEPWEQTIYDTEYETKSSRMQQRKKKRGNTFFLTSMLIMLFLIIAVLFVAYYIFKNSFNEPKTAATSTTSSSLVVSSETNPAIADPSTDSVDNQGIPGEGNGYSDPIENQDPQAEDGLEEEGEAEYAEIYAGDGPYAFAERNGISVDTLYSLNGIDEYYVLLPGEYLRIK